MSTDAYLQASLPAVKSPTKQWRSIQTNNFAIHWNVRNSKFLNIDDNKVKATLSRHSRNHKRLSGDVLPSLHYTVMRSCRTVRNIVFICLYWILTPFFFLLLPFLGRRFPPFHLIFNDCVSHDNICLKLMYDVRAPRAWACVCQINNFK